MLFFVVVGRMWRTKVKKKTWANERRHDVENHAVAGTLHVPEDKVARARTRLWCCRLHPTIRAIPLTARIWLILRPFLGGGWPGLVWEIKRAYNMPRQPEPSIAQNITSSACSLGSGRVSHTFVEIKNKKYHVLTLHPQTKPLTWNPEFRATHT